MHRLLARHSLALNGSLRVGRFLTRLELHLVTRWWQARLFGQLALISGRHLVVLFPHLLQSHLNDGRDYPLRAHLIYLFVGYDGCRRQTRPILGPGAEGHSSKPLARQGGPAALPRPPLPAGAAAPILLSQDVVLDYLIEGRGLVMVLRAHILDEHVAVVVLFVLHVALHQEVVQGLIAVTALPMTGRHRLPVQVGPSTLPRVRLLLIDGLGARRF